MAATALLSVSTPHQTQRPYITLTNSCLYPSYTSIKYPFKPSTSILRSSSSSSVSVVEEDPSPPTSDPVPVSATREPDKLPSSGCKGCGRQEMERGCNGEGRIQGGIATVPGFGWWPIKAYRPCPGFLASGGQYRRQGQSMDEVAFGRGERRPPAVSTSSEVESSQKQGPGEFKK